MDGFRIFTSNVQKEMQPEREALRDFVRGDPLLGRFFDLFLFEEQPAGTRTAREVYLAEVDRCDVYLGLYGSEYGTVGTDGLSATEREYNRATEKGKCRLVYVRGTDDTTRESRMLELVRKVEGQLIRRRFVAAPDLNRQVYASLVAFLEERGAITQRPFDAAACPEATLADISEEKIAGFLARAQRARGYPLDPETPMPAALAHMDLLDDDRPTRAAVLLFGKQPQRFLITSEVKCLHFHGTEVRKPIPSYQVYRGDVFQLVDQAIDFVMSKIVRSVGTRAAGPQVPVTYELPRDAVAEAIVNAVAHRDYSSNASVQVMLFADRLEVWNPGELPPNLTLEQLRRPHPSIPHNPLIAEPLFLARYIEKAGTGILDMIELCGEARLPEPDFRQDGGQFVQTLWRDWLTAEVLSAAGLNERQTAAVAYLRSSGRITNSQYQEMYHVAKRSAHRDLADMLRKGLVARVGLTGKGTYYVLGKSAAVTLRELAAIHKEVAARPKGPQRSQMGRKEPKEVATTSKGPQRSQRGRNEIKRGAKSTR